MKKTRSLKMRRKIAVMALVLALGFPSYASETPDESDVQEIQEEIDEQQQEIEREAQERSRRFNEAVDHACEALAASFYSAALDGDSKALEAALAASAELQAPPDSNKASDKANLARLELWRRELPREAEKLSISYVHFRRIFRQMTGWSPGQYLLECRLRHVEKLLMTSHMRVSESSCECGFEDEFHFSRIFKKHRAMSPSHLRSLYGLQD